MAVQFDGGVVVGADSRTTTGSYIVGLTFTNRAPFAELETSVFPDRLTA
jgi:hypothetical protein